MSASFPKFIPLTDQQKNIVSALSTVFKKNNQLNLLTLSELFTSKKIQQKIIQGYTISMIFGIISILFFMNSVPSNLKFLQKILNAIVVGDISTVFNPIHLQRLTTILFSTGLSLVFMKNYVRNPAYKKVFQYHMDNAYVYVVGLFLKLSHYVPQFLKVSKYMERLLQEKTKQVDLTRRIKIEQMLQEISKSGLNNHSRKNAKPHTR